MGYSIKRLDTKSSKRPRPDFFISNREGRPQMLCEVKTVDSGGQAVLAPYNDPKVKGVLASMHDESLANSGVFKTEIRLTKIDDCLADAVLKRDALVEDDSGFADLPLLVAFLFDFFADFLPFYPRTFDENVSGILTIKRRDDSAKEKLTDEEPVERARTNPMSMFASGRLEFVLVRNKAARRVVPEDFQLRCITEGYDESVSSEE